MGKSRVDLSQKLELWGFGWLELYPTTDWTIRRCEYRVIYDLDTNGLNTTQSTVGNCATVFLTQ